MGFIIWLLVNKKISEIIGRIVWLIVYLLVFLCNCESKVNCFCVRCIMNY